MNDNFVGFNYFFDILNIIFVGILRIKKLNFVVHTCIEVLD